MAGAIETDEDHRQSQCMHDGDSAPYQVMSWCEGVGSGGNAVQVRVTSAPEAENKQEPTGTEQKSIHSVSPAGGPIVDGTYRDVSGVSSRSLLVWSRTQGKPSALLIGGESKADGRGTK